MNAVQREGAGSRASTRATSRSTALNTSQGHRSVLMIDMSRSMFYSDCFTAAKRIALALDALIRSNTRATRWTSSAFRIWLKN